MEVTTNLKLKKPAYSDGADIQVINGNMDVLDAEMAKKIQSDSPINMTAPITAGGAQELAVRQVRNTTISPINPVGGVHRDIWMKYTETDMATWKKYNMGSVTCPNCRKPISVEARSCNNTCNNCGGDGRIDDYTTCHICNGTGKKSVSCSNCSGTGVITGKGTYIQDVTALKNTYPANGKHADGFWYELIPQ